jgi:hypothetical protein
LGGVAVSDSPAAAIAEHVGVVLSLAVGVEVGGRDVESDFHDAVLLKTFMFYPVG